MENKDKSCFPVGDVRNEHNTGLTKREYFAGLAMQGLLANSKYDADYHWVCDRAIKYADELLNQLNETNE